MTAPTATVSLPAAGSYRINPHSTSIGFTVKHMFGLGTAIGTLSMRNGEFVVAAAAKDSSGSATISAASFKTDKPKRDTHVASATFLDVEKHPDIQFQTSQIEAANGSWRVLGGLTVRGKQSSVELTVVDISTAGSTVTMRLTGRLDRYAFEVNKMKGMAGRYLDLDIQVEATAS